MTAVTIDEMERNLRVYLHRVEEGETLTVMEGDKQIAEVKPLNAVIQDRPFGLAAGEFTVPDDFDDLSGL